VNIAVLEMPLLNTMKYKDIGGPEAFIYDLILQLLSYMTEDELKRTKKDRKKGYESQKRTRLNLKERCMKLSTHPGLFVWNESKIKL